jgi:Domain of unknown function (DUF1877)
MSMMGRFVQVSPARLKEILDDPSGVEELFVPEQVAPKMTDAMTRMLQGRVPQILTGMMGKMDPAMQESVTKALTDAGVDLDALARGEGVAALAKLMADRVRGLPMAGQPNQPPASGASALASGKGADISIEKAWHGVHYLLCGKAQPGSDLASQAVMGGTEIGEDLGYGPARYFAADQVVAIARELTRPNLEAEMTARWDPDRMKTLGIYPAQFGPHDDQWLMDAFRTLRQFYVDASAANLAVVTCIE